MIEIFEVRGEAVVHATSFLKTKKMNKIKTIIVIDKDISKVWNVLTDFESYPNWNPFVRSIEGEKSIGKKVSVTCNTAGAERSLSSQLS